MRRPAVAAILAATALGVLSPQAAARITPVSCTTPLDLRGAACGTITVPIDRSGKVPGKTRLFFEHLRAPRSPESAIVIFPGGPGAAGATEGADALWLFGRSVRTHDLLMFDQRGTGRSDYLDCDDALTPAFIPLAGDQLRQESKVVERCAKKLGPQRHFYTTREAADDLEAVRREVGIDKLTLLGISYGTRDAMAYAAKYPAHVDRLILDSVVSDAGLDAFGMNAVAAIPRVLRELCRGGGCDGITSDPVADVATLVKRLERAPMRAHSPVRVLGCAVRPAITRSRLFDLFKQADMDPTLLVQLPVAVAQAARGRPYQLSVLVAGRSSVFFGLCLGKKLFDKYFAPSLGKKEDARVFATEFSTAEQLATVCEESALPWPRDALPSTRARWAEQALGRVPDSAFAPFDRATIMRGSLVGSCKFWIASDEPPAIPTGPIPRVPTLVLAGRDDLRTPAEDALAVARTLPGARVLFVPDIGHSALVGSRCARRALTLFMADKVFGQCHRFLQHRPAPLRQVTPLSALIRSLIKSLENLPQRS